MKLRSFPIKIKAAPPSARQEVPDVSEKPSKKRKKKLKVVSQAPVQDPIPVPDPDPIPQDDDLAKMLGSLDTLNFGKNNTGEGLPDPVSLLEDAIEKDFDLSIFSTLAFPPAPNIIEWCRGREYLNATSQPNARQFQILAHLYGEVCFFCSDLDFIFDVPVDAKMGEVLERFVLLEHGICPICRRNKVEIAHEWAIDPRFFVYHDHLDPNLAIKATQYNELCAVWGQRSGKSLTASTFVSTYHVHRYLGINDPMRYYGEPSNKVFEATFVAPIVPQVNKYLWTPFCQALAGSPWFKEVIDHYKYEGKKLGVKLFRSGTTFMNFVDKRLTLHMAAANSSTLRGGTRILACLSGESLVNTTQGLIPIQESLKGQAFIKKHCYPLLSQGETGRKPVQKTILEKGYSVITTLDHQLKVLTPDLDEVWKEAKDLSLGDFVAVNLGARFPKELELAYIPQRPIKRNLAAYELIAKLKKFSAQDLFEQTGLRGIYMITHRLIKRGMLKKVYLKGCGKNAGCRYEITKKFNLTTLQKELANHAFRNRDLATFPSKMTKELGYLLGYYVSEGAYAPGATEFTFSNTNEVVVRHFLTCFEKVFGFTPRIGVSRTKNNKVVYVVSIAYKVVKDFLRYLGLTPSIAATKKVPWSILQAPKDSVLAFLSAYIEGDGSINDKYVCMYSCSKKLLHQIQVLLLNLGVVSSLKRWRKKQSLTSHSGFALTLSRHDSIQLVPKLTCPTKGKIFDLRNRKHYNNHYRIPFIPSFVDTSQFGGSVAKSAYVLSSLNKSTYDSFALKKLKQENLNLYKKAAKLIDTGIFWLPVVKKRQLGSRPVFDISIKSTEHAFSANGIVVHNCIDELGWFNYEETGSNTKRTNSKAGEEIFRSLDRSLSTLRNKATQRWKAGDFNTLQALMLNISSPSSLHDPIMQRMEASHRSQRIYATHYATYEVNPDYTKESLTEEFSDQIETLMRDYFAIPPAAASPFVSDKSVIENRVYTKDDVPSPFGYEITKVDSDMGLSLLRPELRNVKADKLYPRILTIDNGEQRNSFALCLGRYLPEIDGILFEEFMEIAPNSGRVVDLAWCHNQVVLKLIEQFNILVVGYDRWNSAYSFYDLRTNKHINAERYSLKWQDFRDFKEDLLGENVWMSKPEPESSIEDLLKVNDLAMRSRYPRLNFQVQLLTVNEFARKVIKPDYGNDDLFRCAVLAHRLLDKYRKEYKAQAKYVKSQNRRGNKVGFMRTNTANPLFFRLPKAAYSGFNYNAALGKASRGSSRSSGSRPGKY